MSLSTQQTFQLEGWYRWCSKATLSSSPALKGKIASIGIRTRDLLESGRDRGSYSERSALILRSFLNLNSELGGGGVDPSTNFCKPTDW